MITRRTVFVAAAAVAAGVFTPAFAADKQGFSDAAFDKALKAGKPVLVEVHAPWCPTCKAQAPHVGKITAEGKFKNLAIFTVDFDSQKDALKRLNARQQSTLIVFKGGKEAARSVGDTNEASLRTLIETAL